MRSRYPVAIALVLAAMSSPTASAAACAWTPTTLPIPTSRVAAVVTAADSGGGFAGEATSQRVLGSPTVDAVRWTGGTVTNLGTLPGHISRVTVTGVNAAGTVVGYSQETTLTHYRAFRSTGTALTALPEPAGVDSSWATGVNDNGDIVGHVGTDFQQGTTIYTVHTAVLWPASAPGTVVKLSGGLPTTGQTIATGIDQDGTVLVEHFPTQTDAFTATNLYLWKASAARKLVLPSGTASVEGESISNGRVAGTTYSSSTSAGKGVLWDQSGAAVLPTSSAALHSVNRSGQSTGFTTATSLTFGVWQLGTATTTLSGTLGVNVSADNGAVAGWSRATGSNNQPTVWRCT
ncbi:hypothetical protein [Umezawaea tangerina]|uniref:Putative HAF family extracellular repeat protein n=1 Tax=Umezawaea tangerina TaxID=84725 RepID=A0A2T0SXB2_9PSEU|nr:hypothetical protein [Umezawaea tangerina]PRY38056.1 putative HAF family extracellular repeat protein [Umezawaea tangerina]